MDKKKIKRIIAIEGLILFTIGVLQPLFFGDTYSMVYPEYKAEFVNGEAHNFTVYPIHANPNNFPEYLEETYKPPMDTVMKRLNEMIAKKNISSQLLRMEHIPSKKEDIAYQRGIFISLNKYQQIALIYIALLLLRFPIWAIRTLATKK